MNHGLILNEDCDHFLSSRPIEQMTRRGIEALVDTYAGTQVSHLFFNVNAMRATFRSRVWESIADRDEAWMARVSPAERSLVQNLRRLDGEGLDRFAIWIERSRSHGISPWLSVRMNDVHCIENPDFFGHSTFWKNHPKYRRVPGGQQWIDHAMDYAVPAVREHHLMLIRELLERYDADGIELDWMRFGFHFKPGHEIEGGEILLDFTREVRELARTWASRRGHPIRLAARVPSRPEAAVGLGLDGARWAREGLIDLLIVTPFWTTADFDIPIGLWRDLIGGCNGVITLAAGLELNNRPYPWSKQVRNDAESVRGFSAAMLGAGADQVYLFNYMDSETTVDSPADYQAITRQAGLLATVLDKPRRHIVTYPDTRPPGVAAPLLLPAKVSSKQTAQFRMSIGRCPRGGSAVVRCGLRGMTAPLAVTVNGHRTTSMPDLSRTDMFGDSTSVRQFGLDGSSLKDGHNVIELRSDSTDPAEIVWVELRIDPLPL